MDTKLLTPNEDLSSMKDITLVKKALESIKYDELEYKEKQAVLLSMSSALGHKDAIVAYSEFSGQSFDDITKNLEAYKENKYTIGTLIYLAKQNGCLFNDYDNFYEFTSHETYNQRYIKELPINTAKIIAVKSEKSTGKTYQTENYIEHHRKFGKVLSIGHRRSLLRNQSHRLGFKYYEDIESGDLHKQDLLAITLDSLDKVNLKLLGDISLIILDEVSQVLRHLTGPTLADRRPQVQAVLKHLVEKSQRTLLLDADLTDDDVEFVSNFVPQKPVYKIHNTYRLQSTVHRYQNKGNILGVIKERLQGGEKVYIACNTKNTAKALVTILSPLVANNYFVVTSQESSTKKGQYFINNINEEIVKYQLTIASPSLSTGVDIQVPFDSTFLITDSFDAINHTDLLQSLYRVRNSKERHCYIEPCGGGRTIDPNLLKEEAIDNCKVLFKVNLQGEKKVIRDEDEENYLDYWCKAQARHNYSTNDIVGNFYRAIDNIIDVDCTDNGNNHKKELNKVKGKNKAGDIEKVIDAIDLSDEQFQLSLKEKDDEKKDNNAVLKYIVRKNYVEVNQDTISHYLKYGRGCGLKNLNDIVNTEISKLIEFDFREYKYVLIPDVPHRSAKAKLRKELIQTAFNIEDGNLELALRNPSNYRTTPESMANLHALIKERKNKIKTLLGINAVNPQFLVAALLRQVGLTSKVKRRVNLPDGTRFRHHVLCDTSLPMSVIDMKREQHEKLLEEMNNSIF